MEAGLVEIRQSANRKSQYVSVAPRFSALVVRPQQESMSSSSLYNSPSTDHMAISSSQSLHGWGFNGSSTESRRGGGASGFVGPIGSVGQAQSLPSLSQQSSRGGMRGVKETLSEVDESFDAGVMFDSSYDAVLNGLEDGDDEVTDLSKILNSFLIDPFSTSGGQNTLGPEPLFPGESINVDSQPGAIGDKRRTPMPTSNSPWGSNSNSKTPESPWAGPWANGDSVWSGSRRVPSGGIQSSLSFAAMPAAPPIKLTSEDLPWPVKADAVTVPHTSSLPAFRTSGPPGLSTSGAGATWLSTAPAADWTNPSLTTAELTASMDWLTVAPKQTSRTK